MVSQGWFINLLSPRKEVFNLETKAKAFHALLGLSEEDTYDQQLGRSICMKLTATEAEAILSLEHQETSETDLLDEADLYFANTENLYYRNSRWSESSTLNKINTQMKLNQCRNRVGLT